MFFDGVDVPRAQFYAATQTLDNSNTILDHPMPDVAVVKLPSASVGGEATRRQAAFISSFRRITTVPSTHSAPLARTPPSVLRTAPPTDFTRFALCLSLFPKSSHELPDFLCHLQGEGGGHCRSRVSKQRC